MRLGLAAIFLLLLFPSASGAADIYRYTDERGVIHFVADPDDAPARYRNRVRLVQGRVTRPGSGEDSAAERPWPAAMLPDPELAALPPLMILMLELWRSRMVFSLLGLLGMVGLFVLGLGYTRNIPAVVRRRHRLRLSVSFASALALFWLGIFGPGLARMLRGCESAADRSIELTDKQYQHERLERLRRFSGRAADAVERALAVAPV